MKLIIVGGGSAELERLQRILNSSEAHCAESGSSTIEVVDAVQTRPNEKMIMEVAEDFLPKFSAVLVPSKEPWRRGRPLK